MVATVVFSARTGDIIHVFVNDRRGIRARMDAVMSLSIAMYVVSTYCATETSFSAFLAEVSVAQ